MNKKIEILKYSNPKTVYKKAKYIYGPDVDIKLSSRKHKKYMLYDPRTGHYIHFGEMGYKDYTYTNDDFKRMKFRARNQRWSQNDVYSAGFLSYFLLW